MEHLKTTSSANQTSTVYDQRYKDTQSYWAFKPSSMAHRILEWLPATSLRPKVLDIGCGEGATAIFLAMHGYDVTAFDLSTVGVEKTKASAKAAEVQVEVFRADINEFVLHEIYDVIFSSGTLQYLIPEKRREFIDRCQRYTRDNGLHVLQTFVKKPFVQIAPDAEANEYLWSSGELLQYYSQWLTKDFFEEIKPCNSSGVAHEHVHNRIWSQKRI